MANTRLSKRKTVKSNVKSNGQFIPNNERLLELLYYMKLTRELETRIERKLYRQGKIVGGVYVGRGQEAVTIGAAIQLLEDDWICPSHRDMGAFLIRGLPIRNILAQYMGRVTGPTKGRDGNMHMGSLEHHLVAFVSPMADTVPVSAGIALAFKMRNQKNVVLNFFGDGATSRGDWHEGLNLASVLKVPVVYICNNNSYAYSTPNEKQYAIKDVAQRGDGYGMPWEVVDGNDVIAVYGAAKRAIDRARDGKGPSIVECKTFRMTGHSAHDDAGYVPKEEFEEWAKKDQIIRYVDYLKSEGVVTDKYVADLDARITKELDEAVEIAEQDPYPTAEDCLKGVYADEEADDAVVGKIPWWRVEGQELTNADKPREWGDYSTPTPRKD